MDNKTLVSVLFAAVIGLIGWNIKTTHELTISVSKLEFILMQDAFVK